MGNVKNNRVLVTGGLGYIGSHTVVSLSERGYVPIILDNRVDTPTFSRIKDLTGMQVEYCAFDLAEDYWLNLVGLLSKYDINHVIHMANLKSVPDAEQNPLKYYHNNLQGTINLLKAIEEIGYIQTLVYGSSAAVYGSSGYALVQGTIPLPNTVYGRTKLMQEQIINDFFKSYRQRSDYPLEIVNFRYFNPIGLHTSGGLTESLDSGNIMPRIIRAVTTGQPLTVYGNGKSIRDYVHVMDLAENNVLALTQRDYEKPACSVHNLGKGKWVSTRMLVEMFEKVNGVEIPKKYMEDSRPGDVDILVSSNSPNDKYKCSRDLETMLRDSWRPYNK